MNRPLILTLSLITAFGLYARFNDYKRHPDNDGLNELRNLTSDLRWGRVLSNKENYGDHTSFPGEFLVYRHFLGFKDWSTVKIYIEEMKVEGMTFSDFHRLAVSKRVICLVGMGLMAFLSYQLGWYGLIAMWLYCFNPHLIYHAFDMRPYSVLPTLALLNWWLASRKDGDGWHLTVVFLTCIYHAYGVLIALLPLMYWQSLRRPCFWFGCILSFMAWAYYASYNIFGWSPNAHQAIVDTFEYFPKDGFMLNMVRNLTGGLAFYILTPLVFLACIMGRVNWRLLVLMVVVPIALICLVDIKTSYWIHPRQWVWVVPFWGMFCAGCLRRLIDE